MLIVMRHGAHQDDVDRVVATIEDMGYQARPMPGKQRTTVGLVGNDGRVDSSRLAALPGVQEIIHVTKPYKQVSREWKPESTVVRLPGALTIGGDDDRMVSGALRTYVGAAADYLDVIELTACAPTDAFILCGSIPQALADKIAQVLSPGWTKTPWKLLSILEAECLVRARPGEFEGVAALLRG